MNEFDCAWKQIVPSYNEFIMAPYPKTCTILQYSGDLEWEGNGNEDEREVYFAYNFLPPKTVSIHEEYLISNTIEFIGSIGGTLGIYIGFSISNTFASFMRFMVYIKCKLFD